jgi:enamine deaminase RidA (YjgF/YER057c/UK114 family)
MIERSNPDGMHTPPGYSHVTVATGTRHVHLAGQCPLDADGTLAGADDLLAQVDAVARNIGIALASVDLQPEDVVRTVIYVVSTRQEDLSAVWTRLSESPLAPMLTTASTLLGVAQLGFTGQLVEVDVTAIG